MSIIVPQRKKGPQYVQEVAPSSPEVGDTWYDSNLEKFMMYTTDNEWVEFEKIGGNPGSPYGYICGGAEANVFSDVCRLMFPFDSGTVYSLANLYVGKYVTCGCNSSNFGYICGGSDFNDNRFSSVDRFTFPFDGGTVSHVGNLSSSIKYLPSACNSSDYGYIGYGAFYDGTRISTIDRITFPFDSGTASHVGNLNHSGYRSTCVNNSNYGYFCGRYYDQSVYDNSSQIERITFPFDSGVSSIVGNLTNGRNNTASCNSSNYGYIFGGYVYYGSGDSNNESYSSIERITFPFDSGTATYVGNLTKINRNFDGFNSTNYGYVCGGIDDINKSSSNIDRITFPFDSGTASHVGNLSTTRNSFAGVDGTDFCTLFVD